MTIMKRLLVPALAFGIINLGFAGLVAAKPGPEKDARASEKVKSSIAKLGTGPAASVEVKLREGKTLKGYVAEAREDHFVVLDEATGASVPVPYPQVRKVKGHNLSTGAEIAIVVTICVLVVGLIFGRMD